MAPQPRTAGRPLMRPVEALGPDLPVARTARLGNVLRRCLDLAAVAAVSAGATASVLVVLHMT